MHGSLLCRFVNSLSEHQKTCGCCCCCCCCYEIRILCCWKYYLQRNGKDFYYRDVDFDVEGVAAGVVVFVDAMDFSLVAYVTNQIIPVPAVVST